MSEQKMISVEKMDEIMKDYFPAETVIDYHGQELVVYRTVPFIVFCDMVRKIAGACFNPDTGEYMPEVREFATRASVMEAYTNIRVPQNPEHQYQMLYCTDLWDIIINAISGSQYLDLDTSIDERIRVRNDANRVEFESEVQRVVDTITQTGEQITEIFQNVSADDLQNLVGAIENGAVDENKLVQAVVSEQNKLRKENEAPVFDVIEGGIEAE